VKNRVFSVLGLGLAVAMLAGIAGCAPVQPAAAPAPAAVATTAPAPAPAATTATGGTFDDAFAYCAAIGSIDAPDQRYTGPKVTEGIAKALKKAMAMADDAKIQDVVEGSVWRCMDKQVYGCFVGANIPCSEKADTNKTPTDAMNSYCKENPTSDSIPAAVTGHSTIYDWRCASGKPDIAKTLMQVDSRGYQTDFWYKLDKTQ
jgi:hypothetical protein